MDLEECKDKMLDLASRIEDCAHEGERIAIGEDQYEKWSRLVQSVGEIQQQIEAAFDEAIAKMREMTQQLKSAMASLESEGLLEIEDCEHEYEFSKYCGAQVCAICSDHKGLARCFCGWNLAPGERLEDDIGDAHYGPDGWEVEY